MQAYDPRYTPPDLSMPHFTQFCKTMPLFPMSGLSMQARPIRGTARHPLLGVARTSRRRRSLSLTRIDDDSGLFYYYVIQYCMNN
ncbi:hypothetical protein HanXRQr2_Chr05g0194141 [Helianthus annuus]|uniref:Uncharacterized protein n=1 Tax=Helianthus annuus TaxID=4232 RepID=A0A9K3IW54_HELAN|nr:hypothetical protein HanXRQr2_Chr05g0194141 [Helianthus annuus]